MTLDNVNCFMFFKTGGKVVASLIAFGNSKIHIIMINNTAKNRK